MNNQNYQHFDYRGISHGEESRNVGQEIYEEEQYQNMNGGCEIKQEFDVDDILQNQLNAKDNIPQTITTKQFIIRLTEMQRNIQQGKSGLLKQQQQYQIANSYPSFEEVVNCLKLIKTMWANQNIQQHVDILHKVFHKECPNEKLEVEQLKSKELRKVQTTQQNQQEIRIALSFLKYGYGLRVLRQQIKDPSITPNQYNNMITQIVKATFRSIEANVKLPQTNMRKITHLEQRYLRSPLINSSKWLPPDQFDTFNKFLILTYGLGEVEISTEATQRLYGSMMKQLRQRELQDSGVQDGRNGRSGRGRGQTERPGKQLQFPKLT